MSVVQLGLAAIFGLVGIVIAQSLKLDLAVSLIVGIIGAAAGHVGAAVLIPAESSVSSPVSSKGAAAKKDKSATKAKKDTKQDKSDKSSKAKQQAKEKQAEQEEQEEKEKGEKAKKKKRSAKDEPAPAPSAAAAAPAGKKGKAAPVKVVEPEESEEEEVEEEAPKSKSAIKKAKAKAAALKKEAEERAAAIAAAAAAAAQAAANAAAQAAAGGKKKKKKAATEEKEAPKPTKPTKEEKAALEEGEWETAGQKKSEKNKEKAKAKADAKKALEAQPITQEEGSSQVTAEISVDNLGALIGTGGETLKLIQTATGCTITTPKRDSGSKIVKITGPDAESVQRCRGNIESLVTRGFSSVTHPGQIQDDIYIAQDKIGVIVGPGGTTLKTLQNTTNTKINMPEKTSTTSRATITGAKEAVKAAKAAIKSLMQDGFSPLTHPGWEKVELAFPKEKLGILIGPKGQTIKSIQGNTRTRINIPGRDSPADQNVSVVGNADGIAQAVKEINRLLEPIGGYAPDDDEWVQDNEEAEGQWGIRSTAAQGEEALWD